jgi:hypothetical protein
MSTEQINIGEATKALSSSVREKIGDTQLDKLLKESREVLSRAQLNRANGVSTGLVIGYVQSGKTLSLTAVSSIARDNGYGIIVILCGDKIKLFEQNAARLEKDLVHDINIGSQKNLFSSFRNPEESASDLISNTIEAWQKNPDRERVLVCLVLKNATRINNLSDALKLVDNDLIKATPALIIDDEAHMAGLNTKEHIEEESEVYASIKRLRAKFTNHTYLQYTATPQAPLLVKIADCVSPDFCQILTPGENYVGGKQFFTGELSKKIIVEVGDTEIETTTPKGKKKMDIKMDSAPESLKVALITYLIGVADGLAKREHVQLGKCRSMLVHPAKKTIKQARYRSMVRGLFMEFKEVMEIPGDKEIFREIIKSNYEKIKLTYTTISTFDEIFENFCGAISRTATYVVNSVPGNEIKVDWSASYSHILIGGEVLGVGVTLEGLTVTYMPRSTEKGQYDSMQQRARFFGYRKPYLGLCRVFLPCTASEAYKNYVIHEEDMRGQLIEMNERGGKLKDWRREFFLTPKMKLTRKNVQSLETLLFDIPGQIHPLSPFTIDDKQNEAHLDLIKKIRQIGKFNLDASCVDPNLPKSYVHYSAHIELTKILKLLSSEISWNTTQDSQRWNSAFMLFRILAEEKKLGDTCKIMIMRPDTSDSDNKESFYRTYTEDKNGKIGPWNPMQSSSKRYVGDKELADKKVLTIQFHVYDFKPGKDSENRKEFKSIVVPVILTTPEIRKQLSLVKQV